MQLPLSSARLALVLLVVASLPGCDAPAPPPTTSAPAGTTMGSQPPGAIVQSGDIRARQVEFLNRIRASDPKQTTIERALINEQNELGLILDKSVPLDSIGALMRTMLEQMAKEFPGQDLTVIAYTPSNPPRKIGTGRLNARTRDMSYTPEP